MDEKIEVLKLEPPHGFLIANGKQTAIASDKPFNNQSPYVIVSGGEAFGVTELNNAAQIKVKEFDSEEWQSQHRITPRERRQWWPDTEVFYVYRLKDWKPYEDIKLYENGQIIDEPKLTASQWKLVSKAKELPKQVTLLEDAVSVTDGSEFVIDVTSEFEKLYDILAATFEVDVKMAQVAKELIPIYSLALVRNPRMRVSKKNIAEAIKKEVIKAEVKQEGEGMPFSIVTRDGEFCVIKTETEEVSGCHETREEAEAQLTALNINVTAGEENAIKPKRKPKRKEAENSQEKEEKEAGTVEKPKKAGFIENLKALSKTFLKSAEIEEKEVSLFVNDVGIAQKTVNGELWHFTWSTNAFRDREGEIFSTKSLENYVVANELNENKGYFNLHHINKETGNFNTDFARKEWQGVVGRFLVEAGPYLEDEKGQAAKEFFSKSPKEWGCSPEYFYLPEERKTTVYDTIWITRTSALPEMDAANIWTETRQLNRGDKMALTEKQMQSAVEVFGQEFVDSMIFSRAIHKPGPRGGEAIPT
jgi:hypothetical protein